MLMIVFACLISLSVLYTRKLTNKGLLWTLSLVASTFTPVVMSLCTLLIVLGVSLIHPLALFILSLNFVFLAAIYLRDIASFGFSTKTFLKSFMIANYFDFNSETIQIKNFAQQPVASKFYFGKNLKAPVIFQIHGGGFSHGSLDQINPYNTFLQDLGFHVVVLPYRRIPQVDLPVIIADLKNEVEESLNILKERGFTPAQIYFSGRSAGGYLAMAVANEFPLGFVSKVISFYPLVDYKKIQEHAYDGDILDWPDRLEQLFKSEGVTPETLTKYSVSSFKNLGQTKLLGFHGDRDPVVDIEQGHILADIGKKVFAQAEVVILKNQAHAFDVNLNSLASQFCLEKIKKFLQL